MQDRAGHDQPRSTDQEDTVESNYQAGYAGTGRKVHVALEGAPSNCTGTRWNTRLHGIRGEAATVQELAEVLVAKGVPAASLCRSCAGGVAHRMATLEAAAK